MRSHRTEHLVNRQAGGFAQNVPDGNVHDRHGKLGHALRGPPATVPKLL